MIGFSGTATFRKAFYGERRKKPGFLGVIYNNNMELTGFTLDVVGKIMIAYTAIAVHYRFRKEHQIDEQVFKIMKKEHLLGIAGIILIIAGYLLQLPSKMW